MSGTLHKAVQAGGIAGILIGVAWGDWPMAVRLPQLRMLAGVSILANVLQPPIGPLKAHARTPSGRRGAEVSAPKRGQHVPD